MKLNQLRDVVAVAECGSLRGAAQHLGITQPAITRSIQELERDLGVVLFERRVQGMTLTLMGEAFLRRARGIQLEIQRARGEMEQLKGLDIGSVSIGLSQAAHVALLPRVVQPFHTRYPGVRLRIAEGLFPSMEAGLQNGEVDFYIGPLPDTNRPAEMLVEQFFKNRLIVVGRHDHPLSTATSLAELVEAAWITAAVSRVREVELNTVFLNAGLPLPKIAAEAETGLSVITTLSSSDFLTILPQQWLQPFASARLIQPIAIREVLPAPNMCSIRRVRLPLTPAAEHLHDLFRRAATIHARGLPDQ